MASASSTPASSCRMPADQRAFSAERTISPFRVQSKHVTNHSDNAKNNQSNSRHSNGGNSGINHGINMNRKNNRNSNGNSNGSIDGKNNGNNNAGNSNVKNKGNDSETNSRNGNGNYNGHDEQTDDGKELLAMASSATILIGSASVSPSSSSPSSSPSSVSFSANTHSSKGGLPRPCLSLPQQEILLHPSSINSFNSLGSSTPPFITDQHLTKRMEVTTEENVTVTVRFRPLSSREVRRGDEVAWYADGDAMVRNEYNAAMVYGFDKVFGPATTTRHVYDVAAQHIVNSAMKGVNGTVFAYGVTGSGKTHTMHGDQKSPGIIPLAVKDVFSIIQETPWREFLLRVSYLEIFNEVINDLLDPAGQNLRIHEDVQGTYIEGIKEEVVLSSAHCLSLIAAGEEHRRVGSNNFNMLRSCSHTIFILTIESCPRGDNIGDDGVFLSCLNLIDLAGSESSQTGTTSYHWQEGSYINKSLLTLGTVISKLTDGKAAHIPYRDSKLTRLLQSSLSGHGHISLICTITPASTSNEETHTTLKFAHRTKHVKTHAYQNKIMDEKSLIKKYQKEILSLKLELEQVKQGMINNASHMGSPEDIVSLKQQLQPRLEEELVKAALLGRIQRLSKLILVSTKNTVPQSLPERVGNRRRHSFGENEDRKRELMCEGEDVQYLEPSLYGKNVDIMSDSILQAEKKTRKRSMLAWFKIKKNEHGTSAMSLELGNSSNMSPATDGSCIVHAGPVIDFKGRQKSCSRKTGTTMADWIELLREQVKLLTEEVALCSSSLKVLSEQATTNPDDYELQLQINKFRDEIQEKQKRIYFLELQIRGGAEVACHTNATSFEILQTISKLANQLNEKSFELQDMEIKELRSIVASLYEQLVAVEILTQNSNVDSNSECTSKPVTVHHGSKDIDGWLNNASKDFIKNFETENIMHDNVLEGIMKATKEAPNMQGQFIQQAIDIEQLRQENSHLNEEKDALQMKMLQLAEELTYAKELASAAGVELKNLSEEITKLSYQNTKLAAELTNAKGSEHAGPKSKCVPRQRVSAVTTRRLEGAVTQELKRELLASKEKEVALEGRLAQRDRKDAEMQKRLEEMKRREANLENDLANARLLLTKLKHGANNDGAICLNVSELSNIQDQRGMMQDANGKNFDALKGALENERSRTAELEILISQLKSEDLNDLDIAALEDLCALHIEALTRLCHAKRAMMQEKIKESGNVPVMMKEHAQENKSKMCKMCFSAAPAAVLLPCRHFSLCKSCAVACTKCPLCKVTIKDRIITYTA